MTGLLIIVAAVALALTVVIRTHNNLARLRRQADADEAMTARYNAALERFPASLIAGLLGFHPR